jgi:predicted RNase H-like nuclease (RuvC/YqgF family)
MEKENKDLKEKVERYQKVIKQLKAENEQLKTEKGLSISQSQCETEIKKDDQQC